MKNIIMVLFTMVTMIAKAQYEAVLLDTSTNESGVYGINESGYMVGYKFRDGIAHPELWTPTIGSIELPLYTNWHTISYSISDNFEIGGTSSPNWSDGVNIYHLGQGIATAWIFDSDIGWFVPYQVAKAPSMIRGMNNSGYVAGEIVNSASVWNIYGEGANYTNGGWSSFFSINNSACVAGTTLLGTEYAPTFVLKSNSNYVRYFAPNRIWSYVYGTGIGVNDSNQVVGYSGSKGFYWEPLTGTNILFDDWTLLYGINNSGQIVGTSNGLACVWMKNQYKFVCKDLNKICNNTNIVIDRVFQINNKGQIVGQCWNKTNNTRNAVLVTPSRDIKTSLRNEKGTLKWKFKTIQDHIYVLKYSMNLTNWDNFPGVFVGDGLDVEFPLENPVNSKAVFLRVVDLTP